MAVDMFIRIGDIEGEAKDAVHGGEIDVLSWDWGMNQSGTMHVGGGGGGGKVNIDNLVITKYTDKATPNLMMACSNGKQYPDAVLTIRKAGENPLEYVVMTMEDVIITTVGTGGNSNEDRLTETVTLNFARVSVAYQPQAQDGSPDGGVIHYGWDIAANTAM